MSMHPTLAPRAPHMFRTNEINTAGDALEWKSSMGSFNDPSVQ